MLLLLLAGPARADDVVHGYAKAALDVPVRGELLPSPRARLQADLGERRDRLSWRAAFDANLSADTVDLVPVELKITAHQSFFDLTVGRQYVFWGATDWVNPTDLFTPWYYLHMSSELEDYRIAPWALRWTGWVGNSGLDLVWVPVPQPDVVMEPGPVAPGVVVTEPDLPEPTFANGSFGARATTTAGGFDLSVMGFHGLDKRPHIDAQVDTSTMPPGVSLVPTNGMMTAVGGDLARGFGPVLLKGEAAYYRPEVADPDVFAVAGLTWVPDNAVNFTVQGTWSHPLAGGEDATGLVERAAVTWRDLLSLSVVGVQGIEEKDHFEMAYLSWKAADGLTVLGGVILFGGPEESRFGSLEDDSQAFGEVKASF